MLLVETKVTDKSTFLRAWAAMHDERMALAAVYQLTVDRSFTVVYSRLGAEKPVLIQDLESLTKCEETISRAIATEVVVPRVLLHLN